MYCFELNVTTQDPPLVPDDGTFDQQRLINTFNLWSFQQKAGFLLQSAKVDAIPLTSTAAVNI